MIAATMRGARSRPDSEIAQRVSAALGFDVSGWEIERWRQAGLVQPSEHRDRGRGAWPQGADETVRQAVAVAVLMRKHRNLKRAARVLFVRGLYVREDALRASLVHALAEVDEWIGPLTTDNDRDRAYDKAERLASAYARRTKLGKRIRRRLEGRGVAASQLVPAIYFNLFHIVKTGEPAPGNDLTDVLMTTGLIGLLQERLGELGPIGTGGIAGIHTWFRAAQLSNVRRILDAAELQELKEARDLLTLIMPVLKDFATIVLKRYPESDALGLAALAEADLDETMLATGVPFALVLLPHVHTPNGQLFIDSIRTHEQTLRKQAVFLESLPPAAMKAIAAGDSEAFARLPPDEQLRIRKAIAELEDGST